MRRAARRAPIDIARRLAHLGYESREKRFKLGVTPALFLPVIGSRDGPNAGQDRFNSLDGELSNEATENDLNFGIAASVKFVREAREDIPAHPQKLPFCRFASLGLFRFELGNEPPELPRRRVLRAIAGFRSSGSAGEKIGQECS